MPSTAGLAKGHRFSIGSAAALKAATLTERGLKGDHREIGTKIGLRMSENAHWELSGRRGKKRGRTGCHASKQDVHEKWTWDQRE